MTDLYEDAEPVEGDDAAFDELVKLGQQVDPVVEIQKEAE